MKQGLRLAQDLHGIPFVEEDSQKATSTNIRSLGDQQNLLKKYTELSLLSQFLRSFDTTVFSKMDEANQFIESAGNNNPQLQ